MPSSKCIFSLPDKHCVGFHKQEAALLTLLHFYACYNCIHIIVYMHIYMYAYICIYYIISLGITLYIYRKTIFITTLQELHKIMSGKWLLLIFSAEYILFIACRFLVQPITLTKRQVWAFKTLRSIKFSSLSVSSSFEK